MKMIWIVGWEDATFAFSTYEKAATYLHSKLKSMDVHIVRWDESDDCEMYDFLKKDTYERLGTVFLQSCIIDEMAEEENI